VHFLIPVTQFVLTNWRKFFEKNTKLHIFCKSIEKQDLPVFIWKVVSIAAVTTIPKSKSKKKKSFHSNTEKSE